MWISLDVETDGPIPGDYSMVWFGAVVIDRKLDQTFEGKLRPISDKWKPEALTVSGLSREETLDFPDPAPVMFEFASWLLEQANGEPIKMFADNNGFDWSFINWYFWHFTGSNPLGYSSERINTLYHGAERSMSASFKHLRQTSHTHNPVDDAVGNAEAVLTILDTYQIAIPEVERYRLNECS